MTGLTFQDFQQRLQDKAFWLAVSLGLVPGAKSIVKFGHVIDAMADTYIDIWAYGSSQPQYIFPDDAGESIEALSDDLADTNLLTIEGLDENGLEVVTTVTLEGTVPVLVPGTWRAVNRAYNGTISGQPLVGNVFIQGAESENVFAYIEAIDQQTTQGIYMVPADKVGVVVNISGAVNRGGNQDTVTFVRYVAQVPGNVFRTKIRFGLQKLGTSNISADLIVPGIVPPLTKIKVVSFSDDPDIDIACEFSVGLFDVSLFSPNEISAIKRFQNM